MWKRILFFGRTDGNIQYVEERKIKQYRYLVSFSSRSGMGSEYVTRTSKLDSFDKLVELAKWIGDNGNCENVAILNYQLVSISRAKKEKNNAKKSD